MTSALMISIILSMAMVEGLLGAAMAMEVEASDCDGFRAAACPLTESNILNFDNKQVSFYFVPRTRSQAGFNRVAFVGWLDSTPQNSISVPQKYLQLQKNKTGSCQLPASVPTKHSLPLVHQVPFSTLFKTGAESYVKRKIFKVFENI